MYTYVFQMTNGNLHDTFNMRRALETPDLYIKSKTGVMSAGLDLSCITKYMELFYNFYDPEHKSGAKFDIDNLYRRHELVALYDSTFNVGVNMKVGLLLTLNKDLCMFESKLKIQCGERMLLIKDYTSFTHMFSNSMESLAGAYDNQIVFENLIGKVMYDEHRRAPWLVLYQIQNYYFHKIGIEDEPIRIVLSQREFNSVMHFLSNNLYAVADDVNAMCKLANSLMKTLLSRAEYAIRENCTGCVENTIIRHDCDGLDKDSDYCRKFLLKEIERMQGDALYNDACRKRVLEDFKKLIKPISEHFLSTLMASGRVTRRYSGGMPLYMRPYVAPTLREIQEVYSMNHMCDVCDCGHY